MRYLLIMIAVSFVACTTPSVDTESETATPTCTSKAECNARMRAAATWMHLNLKRQIIEQTDELVQTRLDTSPGDYLVMRVTKVPAGEAEWRVKSEIWCAKRSGCSLRPWEAQQRFNRFVNGAWKIVDAR